MSRFPRPDLPEEALASPGTTIVGGRPPESSATQMPVPTGIQRLLRHAAAHPEFQELLLARRALAAEQIEVPLSPNERRILESIPESALRSMIGSLAPSSARPVARHAATAAALLLGGASLTASSSCDMSSSDPQSTVTSPYSEAPQERPFEPGPPAGIQPDLPPPIIPEAQDPSPPPAPPVKPVKPAEPQPTRGIRPDVPPERPETPMLQLLGGIAPDAPPARPEVPPMQTTGGAAPDEPPPRPPTREMEVDGGAAPDMPREKEKSSPEAE